MGCEPASVIEPGAARRCAFCGEDATTAVMCGGCNRRAFCSDACREDDAAHHNEFCSFRFGEEGLTWEVRDDRVYALKDLPRYTRILVEHLDRPQSLSRFLHIKHACIPNTEHLDEPEWNVRVAMATKNIKKGDEITISYVFINVPPSMKPFGMNRCILAFKFGIRCPTDCKCHDVKLFSEMAALEVLDSQHEDYFLTRRALVFAEKWVQAVEKSEHVALWYKIHVYLRAFKMCVGIARTPALAFLGKALKIAKQIRHPRSVQIKYLEDLFQNSHVMEATMNSAIMVHQSMLMMVEFCRMVTGRMSY